MKIKILFSTLILLSSFAYSQIMPIDDFEAGVGHFTNQTTFSGSTVGILGYVPEVDSLNPAYQGTKSLFVKLIDDPAATTNWFVRLLSGGGTPANNIVISQNGYVGYWLKTNRTYLNCGLIVDDLNASGTGVGTNERSIDLPVNGDGQWHVYQWNCADSNQWNPFIASGNGLIQDPASIDAITFSALDSLATGDTASVWIDYVCYNPTFFVPVELASFMASVDGNQVDLKWITATEKNNRGFEVERRIDNSEFTKIAFVDGKGTTLTPEGYVYSDIVTKAGKYTYRLKQLDFDGTYTYSNLVEVEIVSLPGKYTLAQNYPNPFNPVTNIRYSIPESGVVSISVFNLLGEKVTDLVNEFKVAGEYNVNLNAAGLSSGTYIYSMTVNGNTISKKLTLLK